MTGREFPAETIGGDLKPVLHPQMAAQGLAAKPTFEADDMVMLHRPPDRHRRHQRLGGRALPDIVYRSDQTRQFTDRDAVVSVVSDITAHEAGNEMRIDAFSRLVHGPTSRRFWI